MNTFSRIIAEVHELLVSERSGALADYIPELARVDPETFGIAVATLDGHCHEVGDTRVPFTIQSISKAFTYGIVLDEQGDAALEKKVGLEPSGDAFNEISLEPDTSRPLNPMINAGAIAVTGMLGTGTVDERHAQLSDAFARFAGEPLGFDPDVYESEHRTGHRNRAIAHLLRNGEILGETVEEDLDLYFRQCSILVTCASLARMAATLANGGVNPKTDQRVLRPESVERVLSVMSSSGMYDGSGGWIARVGLPAKSGVGGGIIAVLPGQLAIAVHSPRLDAQGNSVRGVRTFEEFSRRFNLHLFNVPALANQVVRRSYRLSESGSSRTWNAGDREFLSETGRRVAVFELQGDLFFGSLERVSRVIDDHGDVDVVILHTGRVGLTDAISRDILAELASDLVAQGRRLVVVDPQGLFGADAFAPGSLSIEHELDAALEHAERDLLVQAGRGTGSETVSLADCELFSLLNDAEIDVATRLFDLRDIAAGTKIMRAGDVADEMMVLLSGSLDVIGAGSRLSVVSPGVCVGDIAFIDGRERTADVIAAEDVRCAVISAADFRQLEWQSPTVSRKLLRSILISNLDRLRRTSQPRATG